MDEVLFWPLLASDADSVVDGDRNKLSKEERKNETRPNKYIEKINRDGICIGMHAYDAM